MSYPVALKDLILRVRQRSNLEGAQAFITDVEVTDHINQSVADWYDEVRGSTWGGQYYRSQYSFTTTPALTPGPARYPLPPDFLSVTSVDIYITPNTVISAKAFQEEQRNIFRWYPIGWLYSQPIFYQIWGQNLVFNPAPQSAFPIVLNYVPVAPRLYSPNDTLDSINGFEEFIVLDAAIKCLIKDGQTDIIPLLQGRLEQQRERIRAMAPRRDMSQAEQVHMISANDADFYDY